MKSILASLVILVFSGLASADAQGAGGFCQPTRAEQTSIAAIAENPKAWLGKCVTVKGIYNSERLYADVDAIYGKPNGSNGRNASIGGFVDGKGTIEGFWTGTFSGRVADCKVAEDELATGLLRSPGISLDGRTLGCLGPEGPFLLFMSQRDFAPAKFVRRLRKDAGAVGGDLKAAPAGWPELAAIEKIAREFVEALRAGDRKALAALGIRDYAVEQLITDQTSAIADLRKPVERPLQVFMHTSGASEACFCRSKDCSRTWPIARRDADNQSTRPYACVRVDGEKTGAAWTYEIDASSDFDGLPEPR